MPSLISQMLNEQQPQPQPRQQKLNNSIQEVKNLMRQMRASGDAQAYLQNYLMQNPNVSQISNLLKSNGNLRQVAQMMAQQQGIDLNALIQELQS